MLLWISYGVVRLNPSVGSPQVSPGLPEHPVFHDRRLKREFAFEGHADALVLHQISSGMYEPTRFCSDVIAAL